MAGNRGHTTLKCKRRADNPMREYDRLPTELRAWLSSAVLPWRAKSVLRAYQNAYQRTGNRDLALRELDRLQSRLVAKDAQRVWGRQHPSAGLFR
jgi:hypothetical protein